MRHKNLLFFAGALFLIMALRYALGQDEDAIVGWELMTYEDPAESILGLMAAAPIVGALFGIIRVFSQRSARPILQPIRLK